MLYMLLLCPFWPFKDFWLISRASIESWDNGCRVFLSVWHMRSPHHRHISQINGLTCAALFLTATVITKLLILNICSSLRVTLKEFCRFLCEAVSVRQSLWRKLFISMSANISEILRVTSDLTKHISVQRKDFHCHTVMGDWIGKTLFLRFPVCACWNRKVIESYPRNEKEAVCY